MKKRIHRQPGLAGPTRRDFLRLAGLTAAGTLLSACGASTLEPTEEVAAAATALPTTVPTEAPAATLLPTEVPPTLEPVQLQWWTGWDYMTTMEGQTAIADLFNQQAAGVSVELVPIEDMNDKLMTACAGGVPPDVCVCCCQYASFYSRGALLPLDDYVEASTVIKREDFVPGLFESMTYQGKRTVCLGWSAVRATD